MRKPWFWTLVLLASCSALATFAADWTGILKTVTKQVPRLEILAEGAEHPGICSGVVLNAVSGYVLTAAHCVDGTPEQLSITVNGRHAEIARKNRLLDLAVLRFSPEGEVAMLLAPKTPEPGTPIGVAGYMLGSDRLRFQFGMLAGVEKDGGLVIDGVVLPGDSGGPIFDADGRLVGMSNQYYRGTAVGLAVNVERVRDFVQQYLPRTP